jgi:hypothetical protein
MQHGHQPHGQSMGQDCSEAMYVTLQSTAVTNSSQAVRQHGENKQGRNNKEGSTAGIVVKCTWLHGAV